MTILKLPNEGDTHTGTISTCGPEKGTYGEQVKFGFANGDALYIGKVSADRQLLRAGFDTGEPVPQVDYAAVVGNTLTFSRDHNKTAPDKPYWSIQIADAVEKATPKRLAGPSDAPKATGSAQAAPRPVASQPSRVAGRATVDDVASVYRWAYGISMDVQGAVTADALQAGAATLLIALGQNGLVAGFDESAQLDAARAEFDLREADSMDDPSQVPF